MWESREAFGVAVVRVLGEGLVGSLQEIRAGAVARVQKLRDQVRRLFLLQAGELCRLLAPFSSG